MRVSSRIDGSKCGAILLLHRPSLSSSNRSAAIAASSLHSSPRNYHQIRHYHSHHHHHHPNTIPSSSFDNFPAPSSLPSPSALRESCTAAAAAEEEEDPAFDLDSADHDAAPAPSGAHDPPGPPSLRRPRKRRNTLSKKTLRALVDPHRDGEEIGPVEEYLRCIHDPYMRGYAPPAPRPFTFARTPNDFEYPSEDQVIEAGEEDQKALWALRFAVLSRLRAPHRIPLGHIYDLYERIPEPRMLYIHAGLRHQLLRTLSHPDSRASRAQRSRAMLRYFAIMADAKNTGIPLTPAEWNCAMSFAAKSVGTVTETEVEAALELWREMEVDAGVKATNVTFNILFDVACKAGNLTLAEMIYREMEARGHYFNRYHYTSLIHFFGLKLDTSGMRAAYRDMVNAGEMIDTVVLNAVLGGLLRSGEEGPAERLYGRMREAALGPDTNAAGATTTNTGSTGPDANPAPDADDPPLMPIPLRTPTSERAITQALLMFAKIGRRHPPSRAAMQRMTLIAPDLQTYRILVNHHGVRRGDLARVAAYIDDMRFFRIPLHHAIFLALFKGFAHHGGPRSAWSEPRLEGIWRALIAALDAGGVEVHTWLAVWALRAFARCSSREKVLDVYDELKARWVMGPADEQFMVGVLSNLVNNNGKGNRY
ncbi:hypothetical protein C8A05DRAFT_17983 [Staphylotrichum tortipilum]|uniref:Pentatricopeptide repeat protein n=1 Tax=Staphylotrichum tortipilum TaxID=2831512 RepID=A0AAN6RQV0_9PEZI|nr:hypothetical protein C8A05DRAFT_17983 [Staphylotrichum longicolle]